MFIPPSMTPVVTVPPRHVREMQKRVEKLLREFRRDNPELSDDQIREALRITLADAPATQQRRMAARMALVLGGVAAVGVAVAVLAVSGGDRAASTNPAGAPILVAVLVAAIALVAVLRLRGGR